MGCSSLPTLATSKGGAAGSLRENSSGSTERPISCSCDWPANSCEIPSCLKINGRPVRFTSQYGAMTEICNRKFTLLTSRSPIRIIRKSGHEFELIWSSCLRMKRNEDYGRHPLCCHSFLCLYFLHISKSLN